MPLSSPYALTDFLPDGGGEKKPQIGLQIGHLSMWVEAESGQEL